MPEVLTKIRLESSIKKFKPHLIYDFFSGPWKTYAPVNATPLVLNWHGCNAHMPLVQYHGKFFVRRLQSGTCSAKR